MPKAKVNGFNLYYEIHGKGFPLLMILGLSENIYWLDPPLIEELSKSFKVIIFDNRDVGRSDRTEGEFTCKMMADDTDGLMDALDINKAHILGHSMGGFIAQELVLNYPERVEKLILCSSGCGGSKAPLINPKTMRFLMKLSRREHTRKVIEEGMPHMFSEDFIKNNSEYIKKKIEDILTIPTEPEVFMQQISTRFNSYRRLKNIKVPTLILHGKEDILLPPGNAELLAEKIFGAKLIYFENVAHMIFLEEPRKFIDEIIEFLKDN